MSQQTPLPDPFEFLKSLWGPFAAPVAGMVTPTLDPAEIEKRISDLKSVENWLNLNLNVVRMTIQGMEMQKATLSAMQNGMDSARAMQGFGQSGAPNASADTWVDILRKAQDAAEKARKEPGAPAGGKSV